MAENTRPKRQKTSGKPSGNAEGTVAAGTVAPQLDKVEIPDVDLTQFEDIEYPELSNEEMRERAASNKLRTTGPVTNGRSGKMGASLPAGEASPRLSSPVDLLQQPRERVDIPAGATQPAAVVAPTVTPNLSAPTPINPSEGMANVASERAARMNIPSGEALGTMASLAGDAAGTVAQQEKMAGLQGAHAYDEAAAASRMAAGNEKLSRMVQPQQEVEQQSDVNDFAAGKQANHNAGGFFRMDSNGNLIAGNEQVIQPGDNTERPAGEVAGTVTDLPSGETEGTAAAGKAKDDVKTPSPWDNGFNKDVVAKTGMTIGEAVNSYNQWAKENGKEPLDFMDVYTMFNNKDLSKSIEDNEREEKYQKSKERFRRIGNFLSHLGNFIGTAKGAPSQQLESGAELTKRQQALRDKTIAHRQKSWQDYMTAYRQKQADELAKRNAENTEKKLKMEEEKLNISKSKENRLALQDEWRQKYQQGLLDDKAERRRIEEEYKNGRLTLEDKRLSIQSLNAMTSKRKQDLAEQGKETEVEKEVLNPLTGEKVKVKTTTKTKPAGNNTPPSRQTQNDNTKTPPSRRNK